MRKQSRCNMCSSIIAVIALLVTASVHSLYLYEDSIDHMGREFVVMFMANIREGIPLKVFLTTPVIGPVTVKIQTPTWDSTDRVDITVQVTNNNVTVVDLPESLRHTGTLKSNKSVLISSESVVVAYGSNTQLNSGDSFILYPIENLGHAYVAASIEADVDTQKAESLLGVVALETATISFNLPENLIVTYNGVNFENEMDVDLIQYEVFHITTSDVTGTIIRSQNRFAAFSGHTFASVSSVSSSADHLAVMLPPIHALSLQYLVVPKPSLAYSDIVRIVSTVDDTEVSIDNGSTMLSISLITAGSFHEFSLSIPSGAIVTGTKAILVAQVTISRAVDGYYGDPSLVISHSATDQHLSEYTFCSPATKLSAIKQFKLIIISQKNKTEQITLDDTYLSGSVVWFGLANSDFVYAEISINQNRHTLKVDDPHTYLAGILFGYGSAELYQTVTGKYLGIPRDQINTSKDITSGVYRTAEMILRIKDYLPSETPFYNTTTSSVCQCVSICMKYSACYLLATQTVAGATDVANCLLYTSVAASTGLLSASGYSLYRRLN